MDSRLKDVVIYRRLLAEARPYWPHIFGLFLLGLLATPLTLLAPLGLKIAVDSVFFSHPLPGLIAWLVPAPVERSESGLLFFAAGFLVAIEFLSRLQDAGTSLLKIYVGERLVLRFRARLFRHVQRLSLAYHDRKGTADSTYRIQNDASSIQTIAVDGLIPFISAGVMVVAMLYVTAQIDALLAVVALTVAPILFTTTWLYRRRLRQRYRQVKELESSALSVVQEVLTSMRLVKAFGQETREEVRFTGRSGEGMRARIRVSFIDSTFALLVGLIMACGTATVLFVGIRRAQSGSMTLGDLILVLGYLTQLYVPLHMISKRIASLQSAFASAERTFALLDEQPDVTERPDARPLERALGHVEFRGVSFEYEPARKVFDGVSLDVPPGTRVGIAGRTGAGKTTLVSLIARFYDPAGGAILLDGVDVRDYRVADLRNQFAIVLQEPVLFSTSIAENIAYARPEASYDELVAAATAADAHDFIEKLPDGYETLVGERGMTLSGGERQRIALARAFLKDAPILILDEPTSSVDLKTEAAIIEAMERLMIGRTTFMVAHRVSTLERCDLRLEVQDGRVGRVPAREADDEFLPSDFPDVGALEPILSTVLGCGASAGFTVLARTPHPHRSSFPSEVVTCRLPDGGELQLFCKYGFGHTVSGHGHRGGVPREAAVYRHLLASSGFPVPTFYGSHVDPASGDEWLVIEHLNGSHRLQRDPDALPRAARWIAEFHRDEGVSLNGLHGVIPTYDRAYYEGWRERMSIYSDLPERRAWLPALLDAYTKAADILLVRPTVIHGEYYVHNILVRNGEIHPVDWESAAFGAGEIDLATLVEGWEEDVARECERAYASSRWPAGAPDDFPTSLDMARLYVHLRWLGDKPKITKAHWPRFEQLRAIGERLEMF